MAVQGTVSSSQRTTELSQLFSELHIDLFPQRLHVSRGNNQTSEGHLGKTTDVNQVQSELWVLWERGSWVWKWKTKSLGNVIHYSTMFVPTVGHRPHEIHLCFFKPLTSQVRVEIFMFTAITMKELRQRKTSVPETEMQLQNSWALTSRQGSQRARSLSWMHTEEYHGGNLTLYILSTGSR